MKPKLLLGLALVLSGGLLGCSSKLHSAETKFFEYSTPDSGDVVTLKGLGRRLSIRVEADSLKALIQKTKPNFVWNGRDMMWVENDKNGQPEFILDEAYIYQPTNQPLRWVLLDTRDAPFDEWYGAVMGNNLHGVATLHPTVPVADNDAGVMGDYAVIKSTNPRFGTVYEIGWQKLMANGTCLCNFNRRIYVLKDGQDRWHFLGEGPAAGSGRGFESTMEAKVVWDGSITNANPLQIQFCCVFSVNTFSNDRSADDTNNAPEVITTNNYVIAGAFPARLKKIK